MKATDNRVTALHEAGFAVNPRLNEPPFVMKIDEQHVMHACLSKETKTHIELTVTRCPNTPNERIAALALSSVGGLPESIAEYQRQIANWSKGKHALNTGK